MKRFGLIVLVAILCFSCTEKKTTVHLKGQLKDMGPQQVICYNGTASLVGDSRDITLYTDEQGNFDTIIELQQPEYYSISRNTLYLTPGDDLEMTITSNNGEAQFQGTGAEANNYMKKRLFPKGGSFLEAGRYVRGNFVDTKNLVDSLAGTRRAELEALSSVTPEFKAMESARITADIINSYISYGSYSKEFRMNPEVYQKATVEEQKGMKEEFEAKYKAHMIAITDELNSMYKEIVNETFLNVAVVRDVLSYSKEDEYGWFKDITLPERTRELYAAGEKVAALREKVSQETVDQVNLFAKEAKNRDFADELVHKVAQVSRLLPGQPAIDFSIQDVEGNTKKISDFKGKLIYVDLWATWCGPCIQESPFFETLAEKYKDKDIVFIPVSTDSRREPWLSFLSEHHKQLTQYNTQDPALKDGWCIMYIPRFILIDKDFNIINAYAPRPSSEEIAPLIDSLLN